MKKIVMTVSLIVTLGFANCDDDKSVEFLFSLKDRNVQDRISKEVVKSPVEKISFACYDETRELYFKHENKFYNLGGTYDEYIKFISRGAK